MFCFVAFWQFCSFIKAQIKCASELSVHFLPVQLSTGIGYASLQLSCLLHSDFVVLGYAGLAGDMGDALSTVRSGAQ